MSIFQKKRYRSTIRRFYDILRAIDEEKNKPRISHIALVAKMDHSYLGKKYIPLMVKLGLVIDTKTGNRTVEASAKRVIMMTPFGYSFFSVMKSLDEEFPKVFSSNF